MQLLLTARPRYVLLVVGDPAEQLVSRLPGAIIDAEVVPCPTLDDAAVALASGRRFSAVVAAHIDDGLAATARRAGVPVVRIGRSVAAEHLATALVAVATPVPRADAPPSLGSTSGARRPAGRLVAVCGPGGTGASVVAAALAATAGAKEPTLLADFALHGDQAFLHGLGDAAGGLFDLVEAARLWPITASDIGRHTVALAHCRLLPGLRRPSHWTAIRPDAFDAVLAAVLESPGRVVADVTGELEGELATGSLDIEERNHVARQTAAVADVLVVVGAPGANGARRLSLLVDDLLDHHVDPARILPVVNRMPAGAPLPRSRICGLPAPPIAIADVAGLLTPAAVTDLAAAIDALVSHPPAKAPSAPTPVRVVPGSLGCSPP